MLQTGDTLAGYRVEGVAGVGGMGVVYRATQMSLDRPVALKVLSSTLVGNRTFRERFRREGRHAAALDHPNIIPVYEAGESNGLMFIAMRLVDGPSLADLIATDAVTGREALRIVDAIASALDAAHEAGLVHRDIKPQNILLTRTSHAYLADFGITKGTENAGLTHSGDFVGSLNYVAPEQIDGTQEVTGATDIYALTAVLFHCLSGLYPYQRESDAALMHAHLLAPPPTLAEHGITGPPALDDVFRRGMAKAPGDRYTTAAELVDACRAALGSVDPAVLDRAPAFPEAGVQQTAPPAPVAHSTESDQFAWSPAAAPAATPAAVIAPPVVDPQFAALHDATAADVKRPPAWDEQPPPSEDGSPNTTLVAMAVAAVLALVGAPLAGWLLGHDDPPPGPATARSGALTLEHSPAWTTAGSPIAGLDLAQPIALRRRDGVRLAAGRLAQFGPGFDPVPPDLRKRFSGKSRDSTIRLGALTAARHAVALDTGGRLWLALVPDSKGWVAVACEGPGADRPTACPAVAASLRIRGATAVGLGPDGNVATQIGAAITDLNSARASATGALRAASVQARAHAANRLAAAHRRTAATLEGLKTRPQERPLVTALARALRAQSPSLRRLALATSRRRRGDYDAAVRAIALQEGRIRSATRRLRSIGYEAG
ncbi:MAG: serine/threonine kinase PknH [Solirubrobacteraceae bacterium]|nr:serine/threonine kinase PknH [Solirubrobacteraceae bacterium]